MPSKGTRKQEQNRGRTARRAAAVIAAAFKACARRLLLGWAHRARIVWRRKDTNEIHDPAAVQAATQARNAAHRRTTAAARARNVEQQRRTAQAAEQRARRGKHMRA